MLMKYRLFTPGPTSVPEATLLELAKPVQHHRTAEFRAMFNELQSLLQYVYQTSNTVYTITGSGTAAFEAGFTSTVAPGMRVLNVTNGKFAERWASYAKTYSCALTEIKLPYGQHVTPAQMEAELRKGHVDAVVLVHSETSTATVADLAAVAKVVREVGGEDTLLIVDGITSIGALPFQMDEWGIDVAITGSQKSLMLPPGLGYVALSDRAWRKASAGKHVNFYFDLTKYRKSIEDGDTPFTPANTLIGAQAVSLKMIRDETLETVWKRTHACAQAFRDGMAALGLELFSQSPADSVSAIKYPRRRHRQSLPQRPEVQAQHPRRRRPGDDGRQHLPREPHGLQRRLRRPGRRGRGRARAEVAGPPRRVGQRRDGGAEGAGGAVLTGWPCRRSRCNSRRGGASNVAMRQSARRSVGCCLLVACVSAGPPATRPAFSSAERLRRLAESVAAQLPWMGQDFLYDRPPTFGPDATPHRRPMGVPA